ncbi:MAG: nucleoside monophosphate kinase [bacterium]|nr:nucleoside monophosphate kinase [bacterium]
MLLESNPAVLVTFKGRPGVGKGTLAKKVIGLFLEDSNYATSIAPGDLIRDTKREGSSAPLHAIFSPYYDRMKKGELLPDGVMAIAMRQAIIKEKSEGARIIFLDGYPRNKVQARDMAQISGELIDAATISSHHYVEIHAPQKEAIRRIETRVAQDLAIGNPVRDDDLDPNVRLNRQRIFNKHTLRLSYQLAARGDLIKIDGTQVIDDVYKDMLLRVIGPYFKGEPIISDPPSFRARIRHTLYEIMEAAERTNEAVKKATSFRRITNTIAVAASLHD